MSLAHLLQEGRRRPLTVARAVLRRTLEIPTRGLPKPSKTVADDFDRRYGVDTARIVQVVSADSPNGALGERYQTSNEAGVRWCVENAGLEQGDTTFVDIGCGKGKVLIVAAQYPFRAVIGVEYSPELAAACASNLRKLELCGRCAVVTQDAEHYAFPCGDLLVYMYNPFKAELAAKVLSRLAAHPHQVVLAYRGARHEIVGDTGLFAEVARGPEAGRLYRPLAPPRRPHESRSFSPR